MEVQPTGTLDENFVQKTTKAYTDPYKTRF